MIHLYAKHLCHCALLLTLIVTTQLNSTNILQPVDFDPWTTYGVLPSFILYFLRCLILLSLPLSFFALVGFLFYNAFPPRVTLNGSPSLAPFICFRVVTRGDCPGLVRDNVERNLSICHAVGLERFMIEVVTERDIKLTPSHRVRQVVVPDGYRTPHGTMFKARNLQYCLEEGVNMLNDEDYVVHLDEDSLLTEDCVKGIVNFALDGRHHFGQGLVTFNNEEVVNRWTTWADGVRSAMDMSVLQYQFKAFHKPLFGWKGSFMVAQVGAERHVTFDHGPASSVAEDLFFALKAYQHGFTFDFIHGDMWDQSTFTLHDFLRQRRRWFHGGYFVVNSNQIPLRYKPCAITALYSAATLPLATCGMVLTTIFPVPMSPLPDVLINLCLAVNIYLYVFGVLKSFSVTRYGFRKSLLLLWGAVCAFPVVFIMTNVAVVWGYFGCSYSFYVVKKELGVVINV